MIPCIRIHFDNWLICYGLVTAQASLCTISLWFIWTLNLASLQPAIGPLGWDNWFCISHRDGWNNIQDGRGSPGPRQPPPPAPLAQLAAPHFDLSCRLLSAGQRAAVWLLSRIHPFKKEKSADSERVRARCCHCEHPSKELNMQLWPQRRTTPLRC